MKVSLLNPEFLGLLAIIPVLWLLFNKPGQKLKLSLRVVLLALLIVSLSRPVLLFHESDAYSVIILDRSGSVGLEHEQEIADYLRDLKSSLPTGEKAVFVHIGDKGAPDESGDNIFVEAPESGSPLGTALRVGLQQIPVGSVSRVTLISDGMATDPEWGGAVQELIDRKIPVDTLNLYEFSDDAYPVAIEADSAIYPDQATTVRITVVANGNIEVRLKDQRGEILAAKKQSVSGRGVVELEFKPNAPGFMPIQAEVLSESVADNTDNNLIDSVLAVQDPIRVLYIGDRIKHSVSELKNLLGAGFIVEEPGKALDRDFPLDQYHLVMIDDCPEKIVGKAFQEKLVTSVQQKGTGLVFSGGKASFGDGGYYQAAISEALPVDIKAKIEERELSVALAIVIDTSGSMRGKPIILAKQMARLSLKKLKVSDYLGIVEFYGTKSWAIPMQPLKSKAHADRAISKMQADGNTNLMPAIEEAFYGLQNVETTYKHILVISDAGVGGFGFGSMAREIKAAGITLSTVKTVSKYDGDVMNTMARLGGGRAYSISDSFDLVEIDLKQPSSNDIPAYKPGDMAVLAAMGEGWWGDTVIADVPDISGYVETEARDGADILLETADGGHPLLASWRYGLGRVTALMTEPLGSGTRRWGEWIEYGSFLSRILVRTANDVGDFEYFVNRLENRVFIDVVQVDSGNNVYPKIKAIFPNGEEQDLKFSRQAPNLFSAELDVSASENLALVTVESTGPKRLVSHSERSDEYQVDPLYALDLQRLSDVTGGVTSKKGLSETYRYSQDKSKSVKLTKVWPWVLLFALLWYLSELIYRRWPKR